MRRVLGFMIVTSCLLGVATPARAASAPVIGLWPRSYADFTAIQAASGISLPYFRSRMLAGQFDASLITSDAHTAANAGYSLGLNIQPKTGSGTNRTGILYTDISAQIQAQSGPLYDKLVSFANEVLNLPTYGVVPNYIQFHSEAATQAPCCAPAPQPYSGTAAEYRTCYALIHGLFQQMGVTNKIYWQIVLGRGTYAGNSGQVAADWFPTDPSIYDMVGVDGYYRSTGNWLSPSTAFQPAFTFAQSVGKPVWIDEVGADEGGPTPQSSTAKATWFAGLDTYLQANRASLAGAVFTHSSDGGNWFLDSKFPYDPNAADKDKRTVPNYTGTSWNAWKALATDLASPVRTLSVSTNGSALGSVTSAPGGITCGTTCSSSLPDGTSVTLTASPTAGYRFTGWGGVCAGLGTCTVVMDSAKSVTATFGLSQYALSVTTLGSGAGTVASAPSGIGCGATCSANFDRGSSVVLTAAPNGGSSFTGWGGACSGTGACTVTMDGVKSVSASFDAILHTLTVTKVGSGGGVVTGSVGINCGTTCSADLPEGSSVTLSSMPIGGSVFTGWSGGGCNGTVDCTVTMDTVQSVNAQFDLAQRPLTVTTGGNGSGSVTSDVSGINCGVTCSANYADGTAVVLTATAGANSIFTGWSGACTGTGTCSLTMDGAKNVTATFTLVQHALTVTTSGTGTGTVTSDVAGISCGATCTANYDHGTSVVLHAASDATSTFLGWSGGGCSGTVDCAVTMDAAKSVNAQFDLAQRPLTVLTGGNGSGGVTSDVSGITCGVTCSANYADGTAVVLTATAGANSVFTGWSGACAGTGTCSLTMDGAKNVTATFTLIQHTLTVTTSGTGTGTVTSDVAGITCGATCSASYDHGTAVVIHAAADATSTFVGWSGGGCTGTADCTVSIDAAKSVNAQFDLIQRLLTVTTSGNGNGAATSAPAGINCPGTCGSTYGQGSSVVLTATVGANSVFTGWSGACTGTGTCSLTMDAAKNVTATFTLLQRTLTVTTSGTGTGTMNSDVSGINCSAACSANYDHGTAVVLTATPDANMSFTGWSGACTGTGTCAVAMDADKSVDARFDTIQRVLTVTTAGSGSVSSSPSGIACPGTCSAGYAQGSSVALTATAGANFVFTAWSGACTGAGACTVTMDSAKSVNATFTLIQHALTVTKSGTGTGTVTSSPAGINCGATCSASYDHGTSVVIHAAADATSTFIGWSGGGCTGTTDCTVTIDAAKSVNAQFDPIQRVLTVTTAGSGSVSSSPSGIVCPSTCSASYAQGSSVVLTATVGANSVFTGWSGACTGTGTCSLTMDAAKNVTATFTLIQHPLTVTKAGSGTGTITSDVGAINCGAVCTANYNHGTAVTLTATPTGGSTFVGWSGGCTGAGPCNLTINATTTVTATFNLPVTTTYGDNDPAVSYNGWVDVADSAANGGYYRMSNVKNDTVTWTSPAATSLTWVTRTGPDQGMASVTIDGTNKGTVDLYAATPATLNRVYTGLSNRAHTVVIKVLGTKNASSSGLSVRLDAFVVGATTTQESNPNVQYDTWVSAAQVLATDGTFRSASAATATVKVTFTGSSIDWITRRGKANGKASVTIDGVAKGTVDLYQSATVWQSLVSYTGLTSGPHTMVIQVLGTRNASSTSTTVVVDGFVAHGP